MRKNGKKKIDMVQDAKLALVKKNKKCCKTCFREKKKKKQSKELCGLKPVGGIVVPQTYSGARGKKRGGLRERWWAPCVGKGRVVNINHCPGD